jgi:RES domain-containing protein
VYAAEGVALAALELFVHLDGDLMPDDFVVIPADLPASTTITRVRVSDLPDDWRRDPPPEVLVEMGTRWAVERRTAVLAVPSAIVPQESNCLLNPGHPAFKQIRIGKPEPFALDRRMWKR